MKAVVLAGVGDLRLETVPDPVLLEPTDALVRVTRTGLCGADLFPFHGHTPGFEDGTILGHEFGGGVEEVGAEVNGLTRGDRVLSTSTISCSCPASSSTSSTSAVIAGICSVDQRLFQHSVSGGTRIGTANAMTPGGEWPRRRTRHAKHSS